MSNLNQTILSLNAQGLRLFDPDVVKTRMADVVLKKKTVEEALKKTRRGHIDKAVEAGYTPEAREEVLGWSNRCAEMVNQILNVQTDVDQLSSMDAQLIKTAKTTEIACQPMPTPRDAFLQVIAWLGKNQHEFQHILEALGASGSLTPEIQRMLETAGVAAEAELSGVDCTQPSQILSSRSRHPEPSVEKLKSRLNSLEDELEAARQEAKASAASVESLTRDVDNLREELSVEKANARRLQDKADKSAAEVVELDGLIQDQRINATSMQLDLDDKSQEINTCLEALGERDEALAVTKSKLAESNKCLAAAMMKLSARDIEISAHRSVLQDQEEQLRDSTRQLTKAREELRDSLQVINVAARVAIDNGGNFRRAMDANNQHDIAGPMPDILPKTRSRNLLTGDVVTKPLKCAGCGSSTHTLAWCLHCNSKGIMDGCPRCNKLDHSVDECAVLGALSARELVSELLGGRANMPPFNGRAWFLHFKAYIKDKQSPSLPQAFPWTPEFAFGKQHEIAQLQADLDVHWDRSKLPVDPSTKDWETAKKTFVKSTVGHGKVPEVSLRPRGGA